MLENAKIGLEYQVFLNINVIYLFMMRYKWNFQILGKLIHGG